MLHLFNNQKPVDIKIGIKKEHETLGGDSCSREKSFTGSAGGNF